MLLPRWCLLRPLQKLPRPGYPMGIQGETKAMISCSAWLDRESVKQTLSQDNRTIYPTIRRNADAHPTVIPNCPAC